MATDLEDKPGHVQEDNWRAGEIPGINTSRTADDNDLPANHPDRSDNAAASADQLGEGEAAAKADNDDDASKAESDKLGRGFTGSSENSQSGGRWSRFKLSRRKSIATGVVALALGGGIAGFSLIPLQPLKIMHITTVLQNRYFAAADEASEGMMENLSKHYIVKHVMPGMVKNNCTSTRVNRSCADIAGTTGMVSALFSTWRDANIEKKLFDNYGLEIRREGNKFYLHSPKLAERVALGEYSANNVRTFENRAFAQLSRSEVRQRTKTAFEGETRRKQMMYRYSVGALLERKYGIKRCITACDARDKITGTVDEKKAAFKSFLAERVLAPRLEAEGLAVACAVNGFDCTDVEPADENGERQTKFEKEMRAKLLEYRTKYGTESLENLNKTANDIADKGYVQFRIEKLVGETVGKALGKTIPIVGWVDLGARIVNGAAKAGPAFAAMAYVMNKTSAVQMYGMYRTSADEIKTGNVDAQVIGSLSDSLSYDDSKDQGGFGAEQHPAYSKIMNEPPGKVALVPSFSGKASADTYQCDNGKSTPAGQSTCPEETLNASSFVGDAFNGLSKTTMYTGAPFLANIWLGTGGKVIDFAGGVLGNLVQLVPGVNWATTQAADIAKPLVQTIISEIIPSIVSITMSGARSFIVMAMGADAAGNDYASIGLGAKAVSPATTSAIYERREAERIAEFESRPLSERLFDTGSEYSLASRMALSLPAGTSSATTSVASMFANPLTTLGSGFSSVFGNKAAHAANSSVTFTTQHAYPADDPVFTEDPEEYWASHGCDDIAARNKEWADSATINPDTKEVVYTKTNGCKLLRSTIGASGGYYNSDLLESPTTTTSEASGTDVGDANMSETITVNKPGKFITMPARYSCSGRTTQIDSRIAPALAYLILKYKLCADDGLANGHLSHGAGLGVDLRPKDNNSKEVWKNTVEAAARDMGWWGDSAGDPQKSKDSCASYAGYGQCVGGNGDIPKWVRWIGYNGDVDHGDPWHVFGGSYAHIHLGWDTPNGDGVAASIISSPRSAVYTFPAPIPNDLKNLID